MTFKAIRRYVEEEGLFDLVIPIYFNSGILPFEKFLLDVADKMGLNIEHFGSNISIEERKDIIRRIFSDKKHPLVYLDNFETVSLILNDTNLRQQCGLMSRCRRHTNFLNDVIPGKNTSTLLTSKERNKNLVNEYVIDLEGLDLEDGNILFKAFVRYPQFKEPEEEIKVQIEDLLYKTGGHPLSIEIIAKNI